MAPSPPKKSTSEKITSFWSTFISPDPASFPATIFPPSLYASLLPDQHHPHPAKPRNAADSYENAVAAVKERVAHIVRECRRTNEKFTDPDFDIRRSRYDCLFSLGFDPSGGSSGGGGGGGGGPAAAIAAALSTLQNAGPLEDGSVTMRVGNLRRLLLSVGGAGGGGGGGSDGLEERVEDSVPNPACAHRVGWVFTDPHFVLDGYSSSDIRQGASGDCWWLSAVATVCHRSDLMGRVCVARDEACGVYGFVFCRDGEWVPVVVDDYLFLAAPDFAATGGGRYDPSSAKARKYRQQKQQGSEALYFSACADENETWLPLLEKAYAKVHGDYNAIWGGWVGEGVEDITGGVATVVEVDDVLDRSLLWKDLLDADKEFVFGLDILDSSGAVNNGLAASHAYSLLEAREETGEDGKAVQLVKIRNPWGRRAYNAVGEWDGAWSDGSKEWTPFWMKKLEHSFDNDGVFWMSYQDMMVTFTNLYRTRLFDSSWTVVQEWTSVNVAWLTGFLQRKFIVDIKRGGVAVFVLSQLDSRYFIGLEGQYQFLLHFILQKEGAGAGEYICRVQPPSETYSYHERSVSCEVDLGPGRYEVLPKITAMRDTDKQTVDQTIKEWAEDRPQKLRQVGLSYDLAHAKAGKPEEEVPQGRNGDKEKTKGVEGSENAKDKDKETQGSVVTAIRGGDDKPGEDEKLKPAAEGKLKEEQAAPPVIPEVGKNDGETAREEEEKKEKDGAGETEDSTSSRALPKDTVAVPPSSAAGEVVLSNQDRDPKENEDTGKGKDEDKKEDGEGSEANAGPTAEASDGDSDDDDDDAIPPWNAVCVMGLRVYTKDTEVSISLAKPKDDQEAASLDVEQLPAIEAPPADGAAVEAPAQESKASTGGEEGQSAPAEA